MALRLVDRRRTGIRSEPEDASLGELELQLSTVRETDGGGSSGWWASFKEWWNPRRRSRIQLAKMLHGHEAAAHLGPGLVAPGGNPTVTDLINKLGEVEASHAKHSPKVAKLTVSVEAHQKRKDELASLLEELRKRHDEVNKANAPDADKIAIARRIAEVSVEYDKVITDLADARTKLTDKKTTLAEVDDRLGLYSHHRTLVLVESSVMQMRGTFRLARRILAVAAILTLLGGTGYALTLPGEDKPKTDSTAAAYVSGLPVMAVVNAGTPAATALETKSTCIGRQLRGIWVGAEGLPPVTGPFTLVVAEPAECRGQVSVGKGEGLIQLPTSAEQAQGQP